MVSEVFQNPKLITNCDFFGYLFIAEIDQILQP